MSERDQDKRYKRLRTALREARTRAGLTQTELGHRLGKDQVFVSKIESGIRHVDVIEFLDIAKAVGTEPALLFRHVR
jgi:transcriptional regulator with XRE-family HTH domain